MTSMISIRRTFAIAALAFTVAATPFALSVNGGLHGMTAAAREAESGGKHSEAGDDHGGKRGGGKRAGDDRGNKRGGDDHPGAHSQNGKPK